MARAVLLLLSLFAVLTVISAYPSLYVAGLTSSDVIGIVPNTWSGAAMAYVSVQKGTPKYRVRVFGEHNINELVTGAWIQTTNTFVVGLNISTVATANLKYFVGDVSVNSTAWGWLKNELLFIVVGSKTNPKGSIAGVILSRPHTGVTLLGPSLVAGPTPASKAVGMGVIYAYSSAFLANQLPTDFVNQDTAFLSTQRVSAIVIHNVSLASGATWNGPALANQTGPTINNLSPFGAAFTLNVTSTITNSYLIDQYQTYFSIPSSAFPNGEIRGQIFPCVAAGRRIIPWRIQNSFGSTTGTNVLTLKHANGVGLRNNINSYARCNPELTSSNKSAYEGLFTFNTGLTKRNIDTVRGLQLEVNLRGQGQTYLFEIFNVQNGTWTTLGTTNGAIRWQPAFAVLNTVNIGNYITTRSMLTIRVSSVGPRPLYIDLFAVRLYHARALSSQVLRSYQKYLQHLPKK